MRLVKIKKPKADNEIVWETDDSSDENALVDAMKELKLQNEFKDAQNDEAALAADMEQLKIKKQKSNKGKGWSKLIDLIKW